MIPSTPQPALDPRSTIMRPSIAVNVPSLRAPIFRCVTWADAGFVAWKSSRARQRESDRAAQRERGARGERLDEGELAAERATERLGDHADPLEREIESAGELPPRDERALRARRDDEDTRRLEPCGAHLRLDVRLMDPRRAERALDDRVAGGEGTRDVSVLARDPVEHVSGELLLLVVGLAVVDWRLVTCVDRLEIAALVVRLLDRARERGARLHRGLDVDDGVERLVVDDDELGAVLGCGFALGDDERDGLTCEDDLLARERLGRPVGAGRREREVRGQEHGHDTRGGQSRVLVHASDARVRLGRENGSRVQQAVDVAVGRIPRRAGDLVRCVDAWARDADEVRSRAAPLPRACQRPLGDDDRRARDGTPRTRSGRRRSPPAAIASRRSPAARVNGVAPTPVTATVSPSGRHERCGSGQREPGCRVLDGYVGRS